MKRVIAVLGAAIKLSALGAPEIARADEVETGLYLAPKIFYSHQKVKIKDTGAFSDGQPGLALALGYDFSRLTQAPIRLELEYAWRAKAKEETAYTFLGVPVKEKGEIQINTIFANAFFDMHNSTAFTPYIGGGLGAARVKGSYMTETLRGKKGFNKSAWFFSWNVGLGLAYKLSDSLALDLNYRYVDFNKVNDNLTGIKYKVDTHSQEGLLGLRYTF